jgi:WD40 repeat protein
MGNLFISHASSDKALAERVRDRLIEGGHAVFLDSDADRGIVPGELWESRIFKEIKRTSTVVYLNSRSAQESAWCHTELSFAIERGTTVISVDVEPGMSPHPRLDRFQGIVGPDLAANFERLEQLLEQTDPGPGWPPGRCPYPGLFAFDRDESSVFFGRDEETSSLVEWLQPQVPATRGRVLLVLGPSGAGKSSLLAAGLASRVAALQGWQVVGPLRPGLDPDGELRALLDRTELDPDGEGTCAMRLNRLAARLKRPARVLFILDQAEALLDGQVAGESRSRFLAELGELFGDHCPVTVVVGLREDKLNDVRRLLPVLSESGLIETRVVNPLHRSRLVDIIERPARVAGLDVEPGLSDRLVIDAGAANDEGQLDALPLIAFALSEMYRRAVDDNRDELRVADYVAVGGFDGVVLKAAHAVEAGLSTSSKNELAALLLRMVTVDERGVATARQLAVDALTAAQLALVERLVEARLATRDESVVRLVHDRLIIAWDTLSRLVDERHADLVRGERLERYADEWRRNERGVLERAAAADAAQWLREERSSAVGEPVRAYVSRSVAHHRWRARRRWAAIAVAFVLCVGAFASLATSVSRGTEVRARAFLTRAVAEASAGQLESAVADAHSSERLKHSVDAEALLHKYMTDPPRVLLEQGAKQIAWSPRTAELAVLDAAGTLHIWSTSDTKERTLTRGISELAWSPDGHRLALQVTTGLEVYDAGTLELLQTVPGENLDGGDHSWSPDGTSVATSGPDHGSRLWNLVTHAFTVTLGDGAPGNHVLAWSTDGTTVATMPSDGQSVSIWDSATGALRKRVSTDSDTGGGWAWSPDGTAIVQVDSTVMWDLETLATTTVGTSQAVDVVWSPNGERLAISTYDGSVEIWDRASGVLSHTFGGISDTFRTVAWSPDGKTLAMTAYDAAVRFYDTSTFKNVRTLPGAQVDRIAWSADGHAISTTGLDGNVILRDAATGSNEYALEGHTGSVRTLAWSPDGSSIASGGDDGLILVWDAASGALRPSMSADHGPVDDVTWSSSGSTLASLSDDGNLALWQTASATRISKGPGDIADASAIAWSPVSDTLAVARGNGTLEVWTPVGSQAAKSVSIEEGIYLLSWSADGARLAATGGGSIVVWNLLTGGTQRLDSPTSEGITNLAWSPKSTTVLAAIGSAVDDKLTLWNVADGSTWDSSASGGGGAWTFGWSPDGRSIATVDEDGSVGISAAATAGRTARVGSSTHPEALAVDWSSDSATLAVAYTDGAVSVWQTGTRQSLDLTRSPSIMRHVSWSPHTRQLAAAGDDFTVTLFKPYEFAPLEDLMALADQHQKFLRTSSGTSTNARATPTF